MRACENTTTPHRHLISLFFLGGGGGGGMLGDASPRMFMLENEENK